MSGMNGGDAMEYNLKAMHLEIKAIEESATRLKGLAQGVEAVERNADVILSFVYLLQKNISDIVE
jgi:hypothetical protein